MSGTWRKLVEEGGELSNPDDLPQLLSFARQVGCDFVLGGTVALKQKVE
jgi:hypothetical protein